MLRATKYIVWFGLMAGIGIILGCFIHGQRTNQPTVMSGVAFVRELPHGERIVGAIETWVFSYEEKKNLEEFQEKHKGQIQIDPEVLKKHKDLYRQSGTQK
ncbi:MAG: hypothetical protein HY912_05505 [Desulfomonile tiedjei]|uniref:Uncharacterized protein n=1 Tax=Desulfomonile tiedjei TaxID=2358 RepID=A0A9D6V4C9_9BACT|nr:hypothetical protein [Desulfomonile tiedjei]